MIAFAKRTNSRRAGFLRRVGQVIDGVALAVAPAWGQQRLRARTIHRLNERAAARVADHIDEITMRAHDAAGRDRIRGDGWLASKLSPNSALEEDLEDLQDRSRDLARNNPFAASAVNGRVSNVVGCGYKLQARVFLGDDLEGASADLNRLLERKWKIFSRVEKIPSKMRLFQRTKGIYGEAFMVLSARERSSTVPLSLQVISPERVSTPISRQVFRLIGGAWQEVTMSEEDYRRVRLGILHDEFDEETPRKYYIRVSHPHDNLTLDPNAHRHDWYEYDASQVIHSFEKHFPGQVRAVPWLTPIMALLKDLEDFSEANLVAEQVAACLSAFIKKNTNAADAAESNLDEHLTNRRLESFEPGMIEYLNSGEEVTLSDPSRPGNTLAPFMEWHLRKAAAALNYPYELLVKDYKRTTYSAGRLSLIDGRRQFECWQREDVDDCWSPVYELFVEQCVMFDRDTERLVSMTEFELDRLMYVAHIFKNHGNSWIDPEKEINANLDAIDGGIGTKTATLAAAGDDIDEVNETRLREQKADLRIKAQLEKYRKELEQEFGVEIPREEGESLPSDQQPQPAQRRSGTREQRAARDLAEAAA